MQALKYIVVSLVTIVSVVFLLGVAFAGGTPSQEQTYAEDWWSNVYEMRIKSQQYDQIKQEKTNQCDYKIEWYSRKVDEEPKSEYFQYKLESWLDRCKKQ